MRPIKFKIFKKKEKKLFPNYTIDEFKKELVSLYKREIVIEEMKELFEENEILWHAFFDNSLRIKLLKMYFRKYNNMYDDDALREEAQRLYNEETEKMRIRDGRKIIASTEKSEKTS